MCRVRLALPRIPNPKSLGLGDEGYQDPAVSIASHGPALPPNPHPPTPQGWILPRPSHSPALFLPGMPSACHHSGWIQAVMKGRGMSQNSVSCRFPIKNNSGGAVRQC